jgi:hypothetical protein
MRQTIAIISFLVGTFVFPSIFLGYIHWDIQYITTVGTWSIDSRIIFSFLSLIDGIFFALASMAFMDGVL